MPELPEVETTKKGVSPFLIGKTITKIILRTTKLRWRIPQEITKELLGHRILSVNRRGKYLLIDTTNGTLITHLGMSGSFSIVDRNQYVGKHDHFDIEFDSEKILRYKDPRKFGSLLWTQDAMTHKLICGLGLEPMSDEFDGSYLYQKSRNRRINIKQLIMNSNIVVGIGNIYATESLFDAGICPITEARKVSLKRYEKLVLAIKKILSLAIKKGGTSLKDFSNVNKKPGYFTQELLVYGRFNQDCLVCNSKIEKIVISSRTTAYCPKCQT